jgi:hypothetical protein
MSGVCKARFEWWWFAVSIYATNGGVEKWGMLFLEERIGNPDIILFVITNPEQRVVEKVRSTKPRGRQTNAKKRKVRAIKRSKARPRLARVGKKVIEKYALLGEMDYPKI